MIHFNWIESGVAGEKQWWKQYPVDISSIFYAAGKQAFICNKYDVTQHDIT